jgi:hypothetical protein
MKKNETIKILGIMAAAYPTFKTSDLVVELWCRKFFEYDYAVVANAVDKYIDTPAKYAPSIGELKHFIVSLSGNSNALGIWVRLKRHISTFGIGRKEKALKLLPDHVKQVVILLGWENLCRWDEEKAEKKFIEAYDAVTKQSAPLAMLSVHTGKWVLKNGE